MALHDNAAPRTKRRQGWRMWRGESATNRSAVAKYVVKQSVMGASVALCLLGCPALAASAPAALDDPRRKSLDRTASAPSTTAIAATPLAAAARACDRIPRCHEAGNYDAGKAGRQTVVQSRHVDAEVMRSLRRFETWGSTEKAVRFDEQDSGEVTTTALRTIQEVKERVIDVRIKGVRGASAIGHSHSRDVSQPYPGPQDDEAVNAGLPNNIVHDGNLLVVEKVNGQFRVRILRNANLTRRDRKKIQAAVDRFQARAQQAAQAQPLADTIGAGG